MPLNKSKGNMYSWVDSTWNPIQGLCPHKCKYCYAKRTQNLTGKLRLKENYLKDDLGSGETIFVCSTTDMFSNGVAEEDILRVLEYCRKFDNKYLFQSKNTQRFNDFNIIHNFPENSILGTTIETNSFEILKAESQTIYPWKRANYLSFFEDFERMVTIEPIMKFDLDGMVHLIKMASPTWVNIGADSKGHNLPEPTWDEVMALVAELEKFTEIRHKSNLDRLKEKKA